MGFSNNNCCGGCRKKCEVCCKCTIQPCCKCEKPQPKPEPCCCKCEKPQPKPEPCCCKCEKPQPKPEPCCCKNFPSPCECIKNFYNSNSFENSPFDYDDNRADWRGDSEADWYDDGCENTFLADDYYGSEGQHSGFSGNCNSCGC